MEAYSSVGRSTGVTEETLNLSIRYAGLVDGWVILAAVEPSKRGPLLKSRLFGDAHTHRQSSRTTCCKMLIHEGDNSFKNTLKKFFLKGSANLYRIFMWSLDLFWGESNMSIWIIREWVVPDGLDCTATVSAP